MTWMKSSWSSAFIVSLWLRTLGFAFVPATKARGWNSFMSPLGSEERAKSLRTCIDWVLLLVLLLEGGCGIPGGDETL
eukprot:10144392-Ditylum_brightwellii.AAC.1